MSPFDPNLDNDAGHAIDQDDLIAFHLHELSAPEERALRRVLYTNTPLRSESLAIASTLRAFPKHEAPLPLDAAALDRHWQSLRTSLPVHVPAAAAPFSFFKLPFTRWAIPTAAAALAAAGLILLLHHPTQPPINTTLASMSTPKPHTPPSTTSPTSNIISTFASATTRHTRHTVGSVFAAKVQVGPARPSSNAPLESTATDSPQPTFPTNPSTSSAPEPPSSSASTTVATTTPPTPLPGTQAQTPAQSTTPPIQSGRALRTSAPRRIPATELTLGIFGNITASRTSSYTNEFGTTQITQAATPAIGALASFRQQLRPWLGYRLTATYFSPTIEYFNGLNIQHRIYELSTTYVVQGPHHHRLTTAIEAGASVLNFRYHDDYISPTPTTTYSTYRPAAVVGVGAEYALTRRWGLRAEYRALVYKPPVITDPSTGGPPSTTSVTLSSNPILGITYRFGSTRAE